MSKGNIHPLAYVEPGATIADSATIEPYAVIKAGVTIADDVVVRSHAYIEGNVSIGKGSRIYSFSSIGARPQHSTDMGHNSTIVIGSNTEIREYVSINAAVDGEGVIGDNCLIMAYSHIGHNSKLGNYVVMTNQSTLGGHVEVEEHARIGGGTAVHQFARIGRYAMVGGFSRVLKDIPPYTIGTGVSYKFGGLNMIGLQRNGFSLEVRRQLAKAYRLQYRSGLHLEDALRAIEEQCDPIPEIKHWITFCSSSLRGIEPGEVKKVKKSVLQEV